jgi:hypothetical protein
MGRITMMKNHMISQQHESHRNAPRPPWGKAALIKEQTGEEREAFSYSGGARGGITSGKKNFLHPLSKTLQARTFMSGAAELHKEFRQWVRQVQPSGHR